VIMVLSPRLRNPPDLVLRCRISGRCPVRLRDQPVAPNAAPVLGLSALFLAGAYAARLAGSPEALPSVSHQRSFSSPGSGEPTSSSSQVAAMRGSIPRSGV
jgi:hypothetical protein